MKDLSIKGDVPVFSLVMPCYKCKDTIKKAIDSILDQDLEEWELICVVNGIWDDRPQTERIIEKYIKKDKRISMIVTDEANACTARNLGGEKASGEYISFFSSDFYMYPGALRKWLKTFKDNPKAGFIYSGYRWMEDGKIITEGQLQYAPTEGFDAKQLECYNYIDGGFPVKRELWERGKWDPEVKSLNDWDFWLTATKKNGYVGYMMPDPTYAAELPKKGGLSDDSHNNWIERTEFIKKKHKIPINEICVASLGAQPHAKRIARLIGADFKAAPQVKPHKYKAIYLIGFYAGSGDSAWHHTNTFKGAPNDCKKLIHWIGTDVLQIVGAAYKVCYVDMKLLIDGLGNCINISEFEDTQGELASIGIDTEMVPLPIENVYKIEPLPKKFRVAVYMPATATSTHIYNLDFMKDLILSCPDIQFDVFGGGHTDFKPENVKHWGWCDPEKYKELIKSTSCLMRIASHDGMPVAPIEWRLAGRDAITTVQMKHIFFAGSGMIHKDNYAEKKEKMISLLRIVKKEQKKYGVKNLDEARKHYLELTDPKTFKNRIRNIVYGSNKRDTKVNSRKGPSVIS